MGNIDDILNDFQKKCGIKTRGRRHVDVFPTGFDELDKALGIGGLPKGKTTEISGSPGVGKSVLAYQLMKEAQAKGAIILYVDADRAFNPSYADRVGVNLSELIICTPETGELALQVIYHYLAYHLVNMVIIDSIPALLPLEELLGEKTNTAQAKLITTMMKELVSTIERSNVSLVCLNQVRHSFRFGGSTTPFNNIFGYYASLRIHLTKVKTIKKWRKLKGFIVEANVHKNRWAGRAIMNFELPIITK